MDNTVNFVQLKLLFMLFSYIDNLDIFEDEREVFLVYLCWILVEEHQTCQNYNEVLAVHSWETVYARN